MSLIIKYLSYLLPTVDKMLLNEVPYPTFPCCDKNCFLSVLIESFGLYLIAWVLSAKWNTSAPTAFANVAAISDAFSIAEATPLFLSPTDIWELIEPEESNITAVLPGKESLMFGIANSYALSNALANGAIWDALNSVNIISNARSIWCGQTSDCFINFWSVNNSQAEFIRVLSELFFNILRKLRNNAIYPIFLVWINSW